MESSYMKKPVALVLLLVMLATPLFVSGQKPAKSQKLTEEQRIAHVLNRLGFGARPGDVERVKALGLENYINQQLNPEKISDSVAENKVKDLNSLFMTTAELYEKYPQPLQLLRQLKARGVDIKINNGTTLPTGVMPKEDEMKRPEMRPDPPKKDQIAKPSDQEDDEKYRGMIEKYYRENGLQQPQRLIVELQQSRILRAVYSERQ